MSPLQPMNNWPNPSIQTMSPAPRISSATHPASQAHSFEQPHTSHFYPPLPNSFGFDTTNTIPIDPELLDARFDHSAAPGLPDGRGADLFHQAPWVAQPATSVNMNSFMESPTSLPQYSCSMPLVPGMSSFEPMVSTSWSMDGSLASASTTTSASRGPTMSSSLSLPRTSTPASSQSPSSPRKVSTGMHEPPAANKNILPIHLGMQTEQRAEVQPNKKRRQASGHKPSPKIIAEKSSHRNNSASGLSTPQFPPPPAPSAAVITKDNKKNASSSSSNRQHTTTKTTSKGPSDPRQPGQSSQKPTTTAPAQQQQQQGPPQPDPRARNRDAANRCRAKSKVAVAELEATERAMGAEHDALTQTARSLREEVLSLKNQLLTHGNCDDELIQQYLANSARMVGSMGMGPPPMQVPAPVVAPPAALAGGSSGGNGSRAKFSSAPPPPGMLPGPQPASATGAAAPAHGSRKGGARRR